MATQRTDLNEENKLHEVKANDYRETVEMKDTSGHTAIGCSCGFLHPVDTNQSVDTNLGYNKETKQFERLVLHEEKLLLSTNYQTAITTQTGPYLGEKL
jgi:hypothetical protein